MKKLYLKRKNGHYSMGSGVAATVNLMILECFLTSDIGGRPDKGYGNDLIEKIISDHIGCFNCCCTDLKNNLIHINYFDASDDDPIDDLILSPEQLRYIIESWWKLTDAGYEKIVITEHEDGTFTLEGRNSEPEKPKSTFSKFLDFILCRKNLI